MHRLCGGPTVVLTLMLCALAWSRASAEPALMVRLATGEGGKVVAVRDIRDPASPYAGQYADYDRWFYDNYAPVATDEEKQHLGWPHPWTEPHPLRAEYPEHWLVDAAYVDSDGWPVPIAVFWGQRRWSWMDGETIRERVDWQVKRAAPPPPSLTVYSYYAAGVMEPALRAERELLTVLHTAEQYPPIPAWLGENPPAQTVFVPDGEILCYGPLGLQYYQEPGGDYWRARFPPGNVWHRYDREGRLLGTHKPSMHHQWNEIYLSHEERAALVSGEGRRTQHMVHGGYFAVIDITGDPLNGAHSLTDNAPKKIVAAFDYLGNPADPDAPIPPERRMMGMELDWERLQALYQAQLRLGHASADTRSPYAGTPEGPVEIQGGPRPLPLLAVRNEHGPNEAALEVRPLDDPASPYAGQYGPWDRWARERVGEHNPRMQDFLNDLWLRQQAEAAAAKLEGREPDKALMEMQGYRQPPEDPWIHVDIWVDDAGWQIPLVHKWEQEHNLSEERDYRLSWDQWPQPYVMRAGGDPDPELREQLRAARSAARPRSVPPLPQWLREKPARRVIFVPNGDIVTNGRAGSLPSDWETEDPANRPPLAEEDKGYFRYSADGELLGHYRGDHNWLKLFNPQYDALVLGGESQGYEVDQPHGYVLWRRPEPEGGEIVAAFDYDGSPADFSVPLQRAPGMLRRWDWGELLYAHGLRQRAAGEIGLYMDRNY